MFSLQGYLITNYNKTAKILLSKPLNNVNIKILSFVNHLYFQKLLKCII